MNYVFQELSKNIMPRIRSSCIITLLLLGNYNFMLFLNVITPCLLNVAMHGLSFSLSSQLCNV